MGPHGIAKFNNYTTQNIYITTSCVFEGGFGGSTPPLKCTYRQIIKSVLVLTTFPSSRRRSRPSDTRFNTVFSCRCVAGMMRYSVPVCKPMSNEGDMCRPRADDAPHNVTVSYPDGSYAQLNVHMVVCPCASGLVCTDDMACAGLDGAGKLVLREDYTDVDELNHLRR